MLGRTVTIKARPRAVAALSPTTVELVYAAGGTSVTRSSNVRFPQEAMSAKDIGSWNQPNFDLITAEKPDLILADALQPDLKQDLEELGVPVAFVGVQKFEDVGNALRLVGKVLDRKGDADVVATRLEQEAADLKQSLPALAPKVLVLAGLEDVLLNAAGPESYMGNLLQLLGATTAVEAGAQSAHGYPGYTEVSVETITAFEPEVVLAMSSGPSGARTITEALASNAEWQNMPAVKTGRVFEIDGELFLWAPGPRVIDALRMLAGLLYPGVSGQ